MIFLTAITLFIFGTIFGSFAGAQVWRLRALQLRQDKQAGEAVSASEYNSLKKLFTKKFAADRSRCLDCGHQLKWYDLVPIISWLSTSGRCRYCQKPIGRFELAIEATTGLFFVVSYLAWLPQMSSWLAAIQLMVWLAAGVVMAILFAYDFKWFILPDVLNIMFAALGAVFVALSFGMAGELSLQGLVSLGGALLIMSGVYGLLYLVSRGAWIGLGDVKLGVGLALFLGTWQLAFLALFLANLIGVMIILPSLMRGKINRKTQVPFGPLLIVGTILAVLFGEAIIAGYMGSLEHFLI